MKNKIILILLILLAFFQIFLCSKIQRKHKHPGSSSSENSNIEIEPLNEGNENNQNIENNNIQENKDNIAETKIPNKQQKYEYNEDDEFVYGKKDNNMVNLDQELQKRQGMPHGQNINPNNNNNNNNIKYPNSQQQQINPEMQQRIREQQEKFNQMNNKKGGGPHKFHHPPGGPHPPNGPYPGYPPGENVYRTTGVDEHGTPYTYTAGEGPHSRYKNGQETSEENQPKTNVSKTRKALGFFYQLIMIFFLVSFVYNFFLGKNQNDKHALVWYNSNKEYFEERYEYFGLEEEDKLTKKIIKNNFAKNCKMSKENPYYYKLTCANYRYIHYLTVVLEFKKRYDVTSLLSSIFITPKDRIIFQVSYKPNDDLGWIFCVCKKKKAKSLKKSYEDLNYFCEIYEPSSFNNYMALISESLEVFMELFNNKSLFHYYKNIEDYLDAIYFSDMLTMEVEGTNIFFSFSIDLTKTKQERTLLEITHFVNLFVDTLAQLKYNKDFKEKTRKSRIMYERTKMDPSKKKEIEDKEQKDFIDKWNIIRKMKTKKGAERRKLERELKNYQ